jgi:hypothetical protein
LNNKFAYAAAISASPRVNGKTLYATAASSSSSHLLPASRARDIDTKDIIATYELSYQKGKVIALGIYADDIIPITSLTSTLIICYCDMPCR